MGNGYLGYGFDEKIPHFTTFGKNYKRRFEGTDIFEEIFNQVIAEIIKCRFLDTENIFIDGTHIKANASNKRSKSTIVQENSKFYQEYLQKEINEDREINKKNFSF